MNAILAALLAGLQETLTAAIPVLVQWFQKHVLGASDKLKALAPAELRAQARAWVQQCLAELSAALVLKLPAWAQPFVNVELPAVLAALASVIDNALDSAGL